MKQIEVNKIYCGDCVKLMKEIDNGYVDLTVTSPPYDKLRKYEGYTFDFEKVAQELYRVTKEHGVVVWVVGDATVKGSETGTSFKQALYFKSIGFNLHDTMIYEKNSSTFPAKRDGDRYTQIFEYMFIFSKGRPKCNLLLDKSNKWAGVTAFDKSIPPVPDFSARTNIWRYVTSFDDKTGHPAVFPEELVKDHILSWSNEGDIVLDPMCGSGTTLKVAKLLDRNYIGIDVSKKYCSIAKKRIKERYITEKKHKPMVNEEDIFVGEY